MLLSSSWLLQKSKARLLAMLRSMVAAKTIKHSSGFSGHLVWVGGWCGVVLCGVVWCVCGFCSPGVERYVEYVAQGVAFCGLSSPGLQHSVASVPHEIEHDVASVAQGYRLRWPRV